MSFVAVKVVNLSKSFVNPSGDPIKVLDRVSLEAAAGEMTCVLGPSGCGKTTLLRLAAGLERPDSGWVEAQGRRVTGPDPDRGLIFQEFALLPWRTVQKNVELGPELRGVKARHRERTAEKFIRLVGLEGFEDFYPHQLSGGMKQRVAVARALANDPGVILMDEPFGSLDAQTRRLMQEHFLDLHRLTEMTVILVTHSVEEALLLGHRIVVLSANPGRILEVLPGPRTTGPTAERDLKEEVIEMLSGDQGAVGTSESSGRAAG